MASERTVTVTGQGAAAAVPDSALLRVAAVHRAATVQEAFGGVASAVGLLLEVAGAAVGESAVASQGISVWTETDDRGRHHLFRCRHSITVRCASLDVAGAVLGDLVDRVGDRLEVEGVSLEVTDTALAETAARAAAYADAEAKAHELAGLAGLVVDRPITIVEGGGGGGLGRAIAASAQSAMSMPIAAGERSVSASLTVTFALG